MNSSDAKASKCHLKFSSKMTIFIKLVFLSSVISLKGILHRVFILNYVIPLIKTS